jgi:lipid II:glycine glycyltransferase (peptidoglycan interpeptide bridge formation enzyme)
MEKHEPKINFGNQLSSIDGQLTKLQVEYARAKSDPRHKKRAEELRRKIAQLEKARYKLFN